VDALPREIVLELNTRRNTSPIFWAGTQLKIDRPGMLLELAARIIGQMSEVDDSRLTLGGIGDPLLHGELFDVIDLASAAGVHAIHVETDLLSPTDVIDRLGRSEVEVVSVNLPAMTPAT
jgi:MoaA/NifB/PqqE/SkfB family radical SAM enzyme